MALPTSHFHILFALAEEDRHGYSIMKETEELTQGDVRLGPGALYAALGKLADQGLIEESEERRAPDLDDARRRYHRRWQGSVRRRVAASTSGHGARQTG